MMGDSTLSGTIVPALVLAWAAAGCGPAGATSKRDATDETRVVFVDDFDGGFETMAGVTASWSGAVSFSEVGGYRRGGVPQRMLHHDSRGGPADALGLALRGLPVDEAGSVDLPLAVHR